MSDRMPGLIGWPETTPGVLVPTLTIRAARNGYTLGIGSETYVAKDADDLCNVVKQVLVAHKLGA